MSISFPASLLRCLRLRSSSGKLEGDPSGPRYLRHPGIQQVTQDDQKILLVPFSGPLVLNDVSTFIWDRLATPCSEGELLSVVQDNYAVDCRIAANDLAIHLKDLLARHLIVPLPASRSSPMWPGESHAPAPIAEEEVIPAILVVRVFSHHLPLLGEQIDCWSLVSDGLLSAGQKEIVFTVRREAGEQDLDYPRQLLQLYSLFHFLALEGRTVDVGGFTRIASESGLIGRSDFRGIVYSSPQFLGGIRVPGPFLTAIMLTGDEFQVARQYGAVRVTTLLGKKYRFFPCPPWADRRRPGVVTPKDMEDSILSKVHRITVDGSVVYVAGKTVSIEAVGTTCGLPDQKVRFEDQLVRLEMPVGVHHRVEELLKEIPEDAPIAIVSNPDPMADALLYWSPESREAHSISAEDSRRQRIGGNFVLFVPDRDEDAVTVHEDGFAVMSRRTTWRSIRKSLVGGTSVRVPMKDQGLGFEIVSVQACAAGES